MFCCNRNGFVLVYCDTDNSSDHLAFAGDPDVTRIRKAHKISITIR